MSTVSRRPNIGGARRVLKSTENVQSQRGKDSKDIAKKDAVKKEMVKKEGAPMSAAGAGQGKPRRRGGKKAVVPKPKPKGPTAEQMELAQQRVARRNQRIAENRAAGGLMTFSPPSQVVPEMPKATKKIFGLSFTPGGTRQGGEDDDTTPEGLRRMRERERLRELRENPEKALAEALDMEADADDVEDLPPVPEAEEKDENRKPRRIESKRPAPPLPPKSLVTMDSPAPKAAAKEADPETPPESRPASEIEQELARALNDLITAERYNAELTRTLELSVDEKERMEGEMGELEGRLRSAEDEAGEADGLRREVGKLRKEVQEAKGETEKVTEELAGAVSDSEHFMGLLEEAQARAGQAEEQLAGGAEAAQKELARLKAENEKLIAENKGLKDSNAKLAAGVEDATKLQKEAEGARVQAEKKAKAEAERLQGRMTSGSKVLEAKLAEAAKEAEAYKARVATTETENLVTKNNLSETKRKLGEALKEVDELKSEAKSQKTRANALQKRVEDEAKMRTEEKTKLEALKSKVNKYSTKSEELVQALQKAEAGKNDGEARLKRAMIERDAAMDRVRTFDEREEELVRKLNFMDEVRRKLHNRVMQLTGNIRVFVRVRPPLTVEAERLERENRALKRGVPPAEIPFRFPDVCAEADGIDSTKRLLKIEEPWKDRGGLKPRRKNWTFGFDSVFGPEDNQESVWEASEPLVQSAIDGSNVCIFAYGQTGSGKTHTMLGDENSKGLIFRAIDRIFDAKAALENGKESVYDVSLQVEMLEIYNEKVNDLLGEGKDLQVNDSAAIGSTIVDVRSPADVRKVLNVAQGKRCTKSTNSNDTSSRSHMIFTILLNSKHKTDSQLDRTGRLHICDLAGSERLSKSHSNDDPALLKETQAINSSLLCLSNVIEKLQRSDPHVPFRESKLTFLLQNSLGGDSKTLAFVCCSPVHDSFNESLCSLKFGMKVNKVELKKQAKFEV